MTHQTIPTPSGWMLVQHGRPVCTTERPEDADEIAEALDSSALYTEEELDAAIAKEVHREAGWALEVAFGEIEPAFQIGKAPKEWTFAAVREVGERFREALEDVQERDREAIGDDAVHDWATDLLTALEIKRPTGWGSMDRDSRLTAVVEAIREGR